MYIIEHLTQKVNTKILIGGPTGWTRTNNQQIMSLLPSPFGHGRTFNNKLAQIFHYLFSLL
jgi:hypothetical protein